MGGRGALRDLAHRVTETPIRGFWSYWSELMGVEPAGGSGEGRPGDAGRRVTALMAEYAWRSTRIASRSGSNSSTRTAIVHAS